METVSFQTGFNVQDFLNLFKFDITKGRGRIRSQIGPLGLLLANPLEL